MRPNSDRELGSEVYRAQDLAALGRTGEALKIVRDNAIESRRRDSILNEIWARTVEAAVIRIHKPSVGDDPIIRSAPVVATDALARSRRIDYQFGVTCNLQTLVACHLDDGDLVGAADTAGELVDAVARSGAGDLRRALDLAAVVLAVGAHPDAADLAASAAVLPDTNPMVMPLTIPPGLAERGARLDRAGAIPAARLGLADVRARAEDRAETKRPVHHAGLIVASRTGVFLRSGDMWQLEFNGSTAHVRTSKGMHDIARLLAQPGRELHCVELVGAWVDQASTGDVVDESARRQLETRIRELQDEIDEADQHNDIGRSDRAQAELDALVDHLTAALGLGGRARRQGGTVERARSAVTHRIRGAVRRVEAVHPRLGRHLAASITTGIYCRYEPEDPVGWRTESSSPRALDASAASISR